MAAFVRLIFLVATEHEYLGSQLWTVEPELTIHLYENRHCLCEW